MLAMHTEQSASDGPNNLKPSGAANAYCDNTYGVFTGYKPDAALP